MKHRILIANRGEIAVRIIRACHDLGHEAIAVHSDVDAGALHVEFADDAHLLGPAPVTKSYLSIEAVLDAAKATDATAIHPGYGFLAENATFAEAVIAAGLVWIGPTPALMTLMGDKANAREAAQRAGVPLVPGTGVLPTVEDAVVAAKQLGYPVLVKASAGGGGRGIRWVEDDDALRSEFAAAQREVGAAFGDDSLYLEKALGRVKHVEVQVVGDHHGNVVHMFERDCSMQRRRQKLVEEAPASTLGTDTRARICESAVALASSVGYDSAGTVEFLLDEDQNFYFIEMNTRIQVEHGVSEMLTGIDLVAMQIEVALGTPLSVKQEAIESVGAVIEVRINAEDPARNFMGSPGELTTCRLPSGPGVRVDSGVEAGRSIQPYYDSMIAKILVAGRDREEALRRLRRALAETRVDGVSTTVEFAEELLQSEAFVQGDYDTATIESTLLPA